MHIAFTVKVPRCYLDDWQISRRSCALPVEEGEFCVYQIPTFHMILSSDSPLCIIQSFGIISEMHEINVIYIAFCLITIGPSESSSHFVRCFDDYVRHGNFSVSLNQELLFLSANFDQFWFIFDEVIISNFLDDWQMLRYCCFLLLFFHLPILIN